MVPLKGINQEKGLGLENNRSFYQNKNERDKKGFGESYFTMKVLGREWCAHLNFGILV